MRVSFRGTLLWNAFIEKQEYGKHGRRRGTRRLAGGAGVGFIYALVRRVPRLLVGNHGAFLSEIPCEGSGGGIFRLVLRGGDVVLHLPDSHARGRRVHGLADFRLFVGMRHLCLLRGNLDWQAQDGSRAKPEKVRGGRHRRHRGRGLDWLLVRAGNQPLGRGGCGRA